MLDVTQFRTLIVRPALLHLGLHSPAAENLVVGTAVQESGLRFLRQMGDGPALGLFQIEPASHDDLWTNFLDYKPELANRLAGLMTPRERRSQLVENPLYAAAVCRLIYFRRPQALPPADDVDGLAGYWKQHYNTPLGKGTAAEFAEKYRKHVLPS